MAGAHGVSLIGFSAFERSTLDAFFRLAARRAPSYLHVADPSQAQILLVDSDSAEAMKDPRVLPARSLYIGAQGRDGQLGHMPRPINMMALLRQLDSCVAQSTLVGGPTQTPTPAPVAAAAVKPTPPSPSAAATPRLVPKPPAADQEPNHDLDEGPDSELPTTHLDNILVVDDSDIALRFMANCLGRFGFDVHLARSGEEGLNRIAQAHYEFVFMDVTMPGLDGYQTCKLIKKRPYPRGQRAPTVVMLTSRGGMVDKMRGTLAGCDAYLTKPLQQGELMKVIGDRLVTSVADADTVHMPVRSR
jgi:two-component system, cell cycle response regulator